MGSNHVAGDVQGAKPACAITLEGLYFLVQISRLITLLATIIQNFSFGGIAPMPPAGACLMDRDHHTI